MVSHLVCFCYSCSYWKFERVNSTAIPLGKSTSSTIHEAASLHGVQGMWRLTAPFTAMRIFINDNGKMVSLQNVFSILNYHFRRMQGSSIQNVFDDMFKRFRSRSDTTAICDEKKKEICDIDQNAHTQSPEQNDRSTEVIEVCDSEDDCSNENDDVVFLRQTTNSELAKCGDNQSKW